MKLHNDQLVAVNQGGKRRGSGCAYLETWHNDILDFLELRKNTGDDRRRTHDMNTANWIPDLFMKRMEARGNWTYSAPMKFLIYMTYTEKLLKIVILSMRNKQNVAKSLVKKCLPLICGKRCFV